MEKRKKIFYVTKKFHFFSKKIRIVVFIPYLLFDIFLLVAKTVFFLDSLAINNFISCQNCKNLDSLATNKVIINYNKLISIIIQTQLISVKRDSSVTSF